jgi:hypothetical protein
MTTITSGNKSWPLTRNDDNKLRNLERRIYGPIKENGICGCRYNHELYKLCNEPHTSIVKVKKAGWLRWLGKLFRMQGQNPCRKSSLHKEEGTRRVGRLAVRWLDPVQEDLKTTGITNWRRKSHDLYQWADKRPRFV